MAIEVAERLISAEEFLVWESSQPYKHELIDNRVYDMTGASRSHNRINLNLAFALENRLGSRGCEVFGIDIRVQVDPDATYTYPDLIVVCGEPRFRSDLSQDTLENPTLLFEILSPSTESNDRNRKFRQYLQLESLQGYFLVAQDKPLIESYTRQGDDWLYRSWSGLDATVEIDTLDSEIPLEDIYSSIRMEGTESE